MGVRIENLSFPEDFITPILERVKPEYITATYGVTSWTDTIDFLGKYAKLTGKLLKGAEPVTATVAKMILHDWQRGKIPYFVCPPFEDDEEKGVEMKENDKEQIDEKEKEKQKIENILKDIPQNFKKISVKQQFTEEDTSIPEELKDNFELEKKGTDCDDILGNVQGDENEDELDDDALFDEMVSKSSKKGKVDTIDSEDDSKTPKEKFVVVNKVSKKRQRVRGKKNKGKTGDDFEIVKAPRMTTNKRKVGTHFYDNIRKTKKRRPSKP